MGHQKVLAHIAPTFRALFLVPSKAYPLTVIMISGGGEIRDRFVRFNYHL